MRFGHLREHVDRLGNRRLGVDDGMGPGVDGRDQYNKSERPEPEASPATRYVAPRQLARLTFK